MKLQPHPRQPPYTPPACIKLADHYIPDIPSVLFQLLSGQFFILSTIFLFYLATSIGMCLNLHCLKNIPQHLIFILRCKFIKQFKYLKMHKQPVISTWCVLPLPSYSIIVQILWYAHSAFCHKEIFCPKWQVIKHPQFFVKPDTMPVQHRFLV